MDGTATAALTLTGEGREKWREMEGRTKVRMTWRRMVAGREEVFLTTSEVEVREEEGP